MGFFLSKSFGILLLLAAVFALLSCRGPWLQEFPAWFVAVPATVSVFLAGLGVILLLLPTTRSSTLGSRLMIRVIIVLATLGGILLTQYFHGNTETDHDGITKLWWMLEKMSIPLLLGALFFIISILTSKFKTNKEKTSAARDSGGYH